MLSRHSSISMMTQQKLRVVILSIFLTLPSRYDGLAVRARRSLPADSVTDQDVIEALNVLQRAGLARAGPRDDEGRLYPAELINRLVDTSMAMDDSLGLPAGESQGNEDYDDDDDIQQMSPVIAGMGVQSPNEVDQDTADEDEDDEEEDRKEEKRVMEKRPVDKAELEGLFKPAPEVIVESAAVVTTGNTKQEVGPDGKENIVRSEIVKLLSDDSSGDQTINPKAVEVSKLETEESKPGSDGVIRKTQTTEWIFKPDIAGDGMDFYPRPDGLPSGLANKEWLIDLAAGEDGSSFEGGNSGRTVMKKKRSSEPPTPLPTPAEPAEPLGLKKEAVELLKAYIEQQEDENRHLARALNLATLSQVEGSDDYLEEEIDEIKKAAKNEKILETLRQVIALANQAGFSSDLQLADVEQYLKTALLNSQTDEELEDFKKKRGGSERKPDPEIWAGTSPVRIVEGSESDDAIDDVMKNKLRELLIKAGEGEARIVPPESIISEYNRYRLNPFLRDIVEVESPASSGVMPYGDKYSEPDGVCEAVELLADDCTAARSRSLMLDSEATDLCDRHKLCYKCGGYFGMTADSCDRGYMNEAALACSQQADSDSCHEDALGLYAVMISQHTALSPRSYPPAPPECAAPCVYGFIVGADRRRRR